MGKFAGTTTRDAGWNGVRTLAGTANRVMYHVIKAYAFGDSYATVVGNSCGSIAVAAGDLVTAGGAGSSRVTTMASKTINLTANSGAGPDLHVALVDTTSSEVLYVTDETTNQVLYAGGTLTLPSWTDTITQPT